MILSNLKILLIFKIPKIRGISKLQNLILWRITYLLHQLNKWLLILRKIKPLAELWKKSASKGRQNTILKNKKPKGKRNLNFKFRLDRMSKGLLSGVSKIRCINTREKLIKQLPKVWPALTLRLTIRELPPLENLRNQKSDRKYILLSKNKNGKELFSWSPI